MSETKLLPCPFCGGEADYQEFNITPNLKGRVVCSCGAEIRQHRDWEKADLVAAWNTRAGKTCEQTKKDGECAWLKD